MNELSNQTLLERIGFKNQRKEIKIFSLATAEISSTYDNVKRVIEQSYNLETDLLNTKKAIVEGGMKTEDLQHQIQQKQIELQEWETNLKLALDD